MSTDSHDLSWAGVLLALAVLSTGCASLTPPLGQGTSLRSVPSAATEPTQIQGLGAEARLALSAALPSPNVATEPEQQHRRRESPEKGTTAVPDGAEKKTRPRALAVQLAFRGAIRDVSESTRRISEEIARLNAKGWGFAQGNRVFIRYSDYGTAQLRWVETELAAATRMAEVSSEVDDPDMQLAMLRVAGPRLEAAMLGSRGLTTRPFTEVAIGGWVARGPVNGTG